jgi:hypothetical protein
MLPISPTHIDEILNLYLPQHRYVCNAVLYGTELVCMLKPTIYPYTQGQIFRYVTAPMATLYACQLAYVLVGGMVIANHPATSCIRTYQSFLRLRDETLLRFARLETRFRVEVRNEWPIPAKISVESSKRFATHSHYTVEFQIGEGVTGGIHAVIVGKEA